MISFEKNTWNYKQPLTLQAGLNAVAMGGGWLLGTSWQDNKAKRKNEQLTFVYTFSSSPGRRFPNALPSRIRSR